MHNFFCKTTEQGKNDRRSMIINPDPCKHEWQIAAAIEEWEERYRILKDEDKESALPESWRITVLRRILCGDIKKQIYLSDKDFRSYD